MITSREILDQKPLGGCGGVGGHKQKSLNDLTPISYKIVLIKTDTLSLSTLKFSTETLRDKIEDVLSVEQVDSPISLL